MTLLAAAVACGAPPGPVPAPAGSVPPARDAGADAALAPHAPAPSLVVALVPRMKPAAAVHVELSFSTLPGVALTCAECAAADIENASATDATGDLGAKISAMGKGAQLTFARAPTGAAHVSYDLRASSDLLAPPRAVLVSDDRFRAFGESLLLLPSESARMSITVSIDGSQLPAPLSASSLGLGASRTRRGWVDGLRSSMFVAGSLGTTIMDTGIEHDESAWLGYTAFDPRSVTAEIAGMRSLLRETFRGEVADHMVFFISQSRAAASVLGRGNFAVAYVTPDEPWSAALRVAMTKHLVSEWVGGEARIADANGQPAVWFGSGVALFYAAHALAHAGLLAPEDARELVSTLLSAQATLPAHSGTPADVLARQTAQGALYAARISALLRTRAARAGPRAPTADPHEAKIERLDDVLISLVDEARASGAQEGMRASGARLLRSAAFIDIVAHVLGEDERRVFASVFDKGGPVALPDNALGPCFSQRRALHAEMSLGFDLDATLESSDRVVVGLVPGGSAAKAGLLSTDIIVASNVRPGRADVPATLTVQRGQEKKTLTFVPRGKEHAGFAFVRVPGLTDSQCGNVL